MRINNTYTDIQGRVISLAELDDEERQLLHQIQEKAQSKPDWNEFDNYWMKAVADFYDARGLSRQQARKSTVYQIAQDLSGRIAVESGQARIPEYRDELEHIIRTQFKTRREFCQATGISEDMLSHVLAHRKHLAIDTLIDALNRIGYELRIVPKSDDETVSQQIVSST